MDQHLTNNSGSAVNVSKTERIISVLTGAWMVFRMLKHRNLGIINGGAAAYLLYRGLSGHCPGRAALEKYTNRLKEEADFPVDPVEAPAIVNKVVTP